MVTILPMPHEILVPLCDQLNLTAEGMVWGYSAAEGTTMQGYCVVTEPLKTGDPVRILALECNDKFIADGLLRRALHPFHQDGVKEYQFNTPPSVTLLPSYVIIGKGSLAKLFAPCGH